MPTKSGIKIEKLKVKFLADRMTVCADCGKRCRQSQLKHQLEDLEHLAQRISPGEEVPAGECECGALVHLARKPAVRIVVLGGVAECVSHPDNVQVKIRDLDNRG